MSKLLYSNEIPRKINSFRNHIIVKTIQILSFDETGQRYTVQRHKSELHFVGFCLQLVTLNLRLIVPCNETLFESIRAYIYAGAEIFIAVAGEGAGIVRERERKRNRTEASLSMSINIAPSLWGRGPDPAHCAPQLRPARRGDTPRRAAHPRPPAPRRCQARRGCGEVLLSNNTRTLTHRERGLYSRTKLYYFRS